MTEPTTRIVLDVHPGPPIHGQVRFAPAQRADVRSGHRERVQLRPGSARKPAEHDEVRTFSGWIGLLTALQAALSDQAET
jgi:hypothetical protein